MQRGAGQDSEIQPAAGGKGSVVKALRCINGASPVPAQLLNEQREAHFVPGEACSTQDLSFYIPSWADERGENT